MEKGDFSSPEGSPASASFEHQVCEQQGLQSEMEGKTEHLEVWGRDLSPPPQHPSIPLSIPIALSHR